MTTNFIPTSVVKSATRTFTAPIITAESFDGIITTITGNDNPLDTSSYQTAGETIQGAVVESGSYKATIEYVEENLGAVVARIVISAESRAALNTAVTHVLSDQTLSGAGCFNADPVQNTTKDSWSVRVKLHDATGENYSLTLTRTTLRIASYESDTILNKVETWADTIPALG